MFEGRLPPCLITLQRKAKTGGYFAQERFGSRARDEVTDEIALNPSQFEAHTDAETLAVLVHEMVHLEQFRCHPDTVSRPGYCNKTWARLMHRVGLVPSHTGQPGGRETGQHVSHYVEPGGRFEQACAALLASGFQVPYVDLWERPRPARKKRNEKPSTRAADAV